MDARSSRLVAVVALGLVVPGAGVASAQDSEVHVDPDSPAGKEYALPLDSARRDACGSPDGTGGSGGTGQSAPLFGAGVSNATGSGGSEGSDSGGGQGDGSSSADRGGGKSAVSGADTTHVARAVADRGGGLSAAVI